MIAERQWLTKRTVCDNCHQETDGWLSQCPECSSPDITHDTLISLTPPQQPYIAGEVLVGEVEITGCFNCLELSCGRHTVCPECQSVNLIYVRQPIKIRY